MIYLNVNDKPLTWFLKRGMGKYLRAKGRGLGKAAVRLSTPDVDKGAQCSEIHRNYQKGETDCSQLASCNPFVQPLTLQSQFEGGGRLHLASALFIALFLLDQDLS